MRAVTRLIDKGFEAYLVGGCVRDLLLDRTPKDYDIATEARPPQVKRTFPRNCRIIGRRFKLAHLHFHGNTKILECSTFRRTPEERPDGDGDDADLLITRDNEFGTAVEDALRRDFTVNALFLDPTRDLIVDHVHGLEDIEARVIRTIGDPVVRFREDPVRILRAVKFAGRLGFTIEKQTLLAMGETAADLVRAAPPRVLEEILRLLRSGHALDSFRLLQQVGAIQHLIPVVGKFLKRASKVQEDAFWGLLEALDRRVQSQPVNSEPAPNGVLLAALMYGAVDAERERQPTRSPSSIAESLLGSLAIDLRLPRRDSGCLKRICGVQHRFDQTESKRRFRVEAFVHSPYFEEALQLYALRTAAASSDRSNVDHWYDLAGTHPVTAHDEDDGFEPADDHEATMTEGVADDFEAADEATADESDRGARRKKRRRRRRRRGDDEEVGASEVEASAAMSATSARAGDEADADADAASDEMPSANEAEAIDPDEQAPATGVKAAKKRVRKRAPRRPARTDDDDISDVTFPSSEAPAPHGDPMQPHAKSLTHPKQQIAGKVHQEAGAFPKDHGNEQADGEQATKRSRAYDDEATPSFDDRTNDIDTDLPDDEDHDRRPRRRRSRRSRSSSDEAEVSRGTMAATEDDADRTANDDDYRNHDDYRRSDDDRHDADARDDEQRDDHHDDEHGDETAVADREDAREGDEDGNTPARKRRRRGRRGRGRTRNDDEQREPAGEPAEVRGQAPMREHEIRGGNEARQQKAGPATSRDAKSREPRSKEPRSRDHGKAANSRDGRDRNQPKRDQKRDHKREPMRDGQRRDGKRGNKPARISGARDVDVVPRYRDRRGKVEVIEPAALDLSAFDVELDPKRVPTFGSIVEGKGRPKRRSPRIMDGDNDGYRPPPPPGSDGIRPDSPPPPPPSDGPDTFGDW